MRIPFHRKRKTTACGSRSPDQVRAARRSESKTRVDALSARACFIPSFADLVVLAGSLNPIPSRTRPLNSPAPMVLSLKAWKSRSLPGLPRTETSSRLPFQSRRGIPAAAFFRVRCDGCKSPAEQRNRAATVSSRAREREFGCRITVGGWLVASRLQRNRTRTRR